MRKLGLPSFFLEFVLSLVILSVSLVIILATFIRSAQIDQKNQAMQNLLPEMLKISELARLPESNFDHEEILSYDQIGHKSNELIRYQIIVSPSLVGTLRVVNIELLDIQGNRLHAWTIKTKVSD